MNNKLTDYFNMQKYGCYIGVKITEDSIKSLNELCYMLNVKKPIDFNEVSVPLIAMRNLNRIYSESAIKQDFIPYKNIEYTATCLSIRVDENNNRLILELICPELHSRYNDLCNIGFVDHYPIREGVYMPYIVLSEEYSSEKLKNELVKGKKITLKGEIFEPILPEKFINGVRYI